MTRALRYATRPAPLERADDTLGSAGVSVPGSNRDARDEEERLVRRVQQTGDEAAFDEIVRRYQAAVFRLALAVLGPGADTEAEDVAQEVFLRAHRQLAGFRGVSRLGTWLYRITFNVAVDRRRLARWSKPHVGDEVLRAAGSDQRQSNPRELAADVERKRLMEGVLDRLPDAARMVLHLHYWLGSSVDEIAELLRMPAGSVKSWLHRGRRMVGAELRARGIDDAI